MLWGAAGDIVLRVILIGFALNLLHGVDWRIVRIFYRSTVEAPQPARAIRQIRPVFPAYKGM
jgi:hypothetical protein